MIPKMRCGSLFPALTLVVMTGSVLAQDKSAPPPAVSAIESREDEPKQKTCPVCAIGHMILIQVFRTERLDSS